VYAGEKNSWTPKKAASIIGHFDFFLLLNHGVSVDITGGDGRMPLRETACNGHREVNLQLQSIGGIVHIARKPDLTVLLAAVDSDQFL
jgi:hypothetical protein